MIFIGSTSQSLSSESESQTIDFGPVIQRINNQAQSSIMRLFSGTSEQKHIAQHLYENLINGSLGGIYTVSHKLPALKGMWSGKRWQTLLGNAPSKCWKQPEGQKPIIIVSEQVSANPELLDSALVDAYRQCGYRELDVIVKKQISNPFIPCVGKQASVSLYSPVTDVLINPPCQTDHNGVCHFALPPAIYLFEVKCNNDPTSPEVIFREVKAGEGTQTEGFNNLFWIPQNWKKFKND